MIKDKRETRLSDLRIDNDLTQGQIAKIIGVKGDTYSQWERKRNDIPLLKINELANYYDVSIDYILGISNKSFNTEHKDIDLDVMKKRLVELRKEHKLTQEKLSSSVGFPQTTYSSYENGNYTPTTFKLSYISLYYNVSYDYLVGRTDQKEIK